MEDNEKELYEVEDEEEEEAGDEGEDEESVCVSDLAEQTSMRARALGLGSPCPTRLGGISCSRPRLPRLFPI